MLKKMMKPNLLIFTAVFFLWGHSAVASSEAVEDPSNVFSFDQVVEKYKCNESHSNPVCAATNYLLCKYAFDFEKCNSIGVSGKSYKAFLSQTTLKPETLENSFFSFSRHKIVDSSDPWLPEWMYPKAVFIRGYSVEPTDLTEGNWNKLIHQGPASVSLQKFGYGMVFIWKNKRWELWKTEHPNPHDCRNDFQDQPIKNPLCFEHMWYDDDERLIHQIFFE